MHLEQHRFHSTTTKTDVGDAVELYVAQSIFHGWGMVLDSDNLMAGGGQPERHGTDTGVSIDNQGWRVICVRLDRIINDFEKPHGLGLIDLKEAGRRKAVRNAIAQPLRQIETIRFQYFF